MTGKYETEKHNCIDCKYYIESQYRWPDWCVRSLLDIYEPDIETCDEFEEGN